MVKDSLKTLLNKYPWFLNKSEDSNFFKSQYVSNRRFQELYQSLFDVFNSFHLGKRCLIWKDQSEPYDYYINFVVNFPHLKSVNCYKNDLLIYSEHYDYDDNVDSFIYIYDSSLDMGGLEELLDNNDEEIEDIPIIPEDTFKVIVETYDEYIITKGFPENDEIQGNEFDHDESLDEIGAQNNISRKTYIETLDYANTEPPYNNRSTEDDYHYMNRIINYVLRVHDTPLPVLEIWKQYGIFSDMLNREQYLLKMFDETKHPFDEETGLVKDWTPQPWEHKDKLCNLQPDLGRFFFVSANTLMPVKNQSVRFNFKYLNSLAEDLTGDYTVTIKLQGEEEDTTLVENYTGSQYIVTSDLIQEDEPNIFIFEAYDGETLFATEELTITVRGCSNADWYVSVNGDDDEGTGESDNPFKTLDKALSMVNGEQNLIVLMSGTHTTNHTFNVPYSCTVLGCGGASITNSDSLRFFKVYQNRSLTLQDVTLTYENTSVLVDNSNFINNNKSNTPLYVLLKEHEGNSIIVTASASYVKSGDEITITITLSDENGAPIEDADVDLYKIT